MTQKTDGVIQPAVAWRQDPVLLAFTEPDRRAAVTALDMETGIWFLGIHNQLRQGRSGRPTANSSKWVSEWVGVLDRRYRDPQLEGGSSLRLLWQQGERTAMGLGDLATDRQP